MTPQTATATAIATTAPSPLDPTLRDAMLAALPYPANATDAQIAQQQGCALGMFASMNPGDPMETALAVRVVVVNYAMMACFHSAARSDLPETLKAKYHGRAAQHARLMDSTLRELRKRQKEAGRPMGMVPGQAKAAPPPQPPEPARQEIARQEIARQDADASDVARREASRLEAELRAVMAPSKPGGRPLSQAQKDKVLRDIARRSFTAAASFAA